jgi:carbon-monoxide dehydrogenase small subunit
MIPISFKLNGVPVQLTAHPMASLLDALRENLGATGTKYGCGEGECGACTVLIEGVSAMSCMVPVCQVEGQHVETIEGLATPGATGELHPIQQAFLHCGGAQCGICTPGMIMAAEYYRRNPECAPGGVREALEGNLCRCTGYTRIFEAVETVINIASASKR